MKWLLPFLCLVLAVASAQVVEGAGGPPLLGSLLFGALVGTAGVLGGRALRGGDRR